MVSINTEETIDLTMTLMRFVWIDEDSVMQTYYITAIHRNKNKNLGKFSVLLQRLALCLSVFVIIIFVFHFM